MNHCNGGKRDLSVEPGPISNTVKTAGDFQTTSRMKVSVAKFLSTAGPCRPSKGQGVGEARPS